MWNSNSRNHRRGEGRGGFAFMASSCNCPASCCFVTDANGLLGRRQNPPAINKVAGRLSLYSFPPSPATGGGRTFTIVSAKRVSSSRRTERVDERDTIPSSSSFSSVSPATVPLEEEYEGDFDEEYDVPKLPGEEPDFWEGPKWDTFGFIIRYLWAFGFVFGLVACGVAVRTYNFGATDFKETPVYKEAIESQGLFDEAPETSNSEIFENNPTEDAPLLSP